MTLNFTIDENDFLTHQLYIASKSELVQKKRKRNRIIVPVIYVAFGLYFFLDDNAPLAIIFLIIAALWYFFYPRWDKNRYVNHYKSFIKENFKDRFGRMATLEISDTHILATDYANETKIMTTEIEKINEIPSTIFIRIKGGHSFILPKMKIGDIENVKARLREFAGYWKVEYGVEENWEWK